MIPVFDGHNDALSRLVASGITAPAAAFLDGTADGHIDYPRAGAGGMIGGMFAVFSPSPGDHAMASHRTADGVDVPLPPALAAEDARASALAQIALLRRIARRSAGRVTVCSSRAAIDAAVAAGSLAVVLHLEGAEAIDPDLAMLEVLHAAGLRSLGPVWSRPNAFGYGVPFRFPSSPDTGPGLTDAGAALVRACNELRILVDMSHLTEQGFWDVMRHSEAPPVATHSNAHALCPAARNLTDRQLDAIRERNGMVGVNFATAFLRSDGDMRADTGIELLLRQLDYLIERLGEDKVGLGSDFDGAVVPAAVADIGAIQTLFAHLATRGYDRPLLERIGYRNWLDVLARTIG